MPNLREGGKSRRRERILEAARALLREEGGFTTERIAQRAQVVPATVYNLLGPRERVLEALARSFADELRERLDAPEPGDPIGRSRHIARTTVAMFVEDPAVARELVRSWPQSAHLIGPTPLSRMRAALEEARSDGILRSDARTRQMSELIATACLGALHQWAAGLIDDTTFRRRAITAVDMAVAAAASDRQRERLWRRLRG
jgi:AcrR family transcriptional regulator